MTRQVARFSGHDAFNSVLREDWINAIKLSPDSWDAYLYRPTGTEQASENAENYQEQVALEVDTNQDTLIYADPVDVKVLDCPDEQENFLLTDDGEELGENAQALLMRVADTSVPKGSVLEWDEETASGVRTVWWYVHDTMGYGASTVGVLYVCIPMRDFSAEGLKLVEEAVKPAETSSEEPEQAPPAPEDEPDLIYL